jgi:hypothetical protein
VAFTGCVQKRYTTDFLLAEVVRSVEGSSMVFFVRLTGFTFFVIKKKVKPVLSAFFSKFSSRGGLEQQKP